MKKSIAIVTDKASKLCLFLEENLRLVLGDYVNINHYFLDEIKENNKITENLVLVMTKDRMHQISRNISDDNKIIAIRRTFREDKIYNLFSIPKGTSVLVVNDTDETTLETISLFYKIGITNLKLTPCLRGKTYEDIDIAITPGVVNKVPSHIKNIIDLGNRHIDISTFIEIINGLDIDLKNIRESLIKYSDQIVSLDDGVKDKYKELFLKVEELDTVLNLSKDGIIFTSKNDIIKTFNKNALEILNIRSDINKKNINDVFTGELKVLLDNKDILDEVVFCNKKYININKKSIYNMGDKVGTYYNFQEITYIKKLEQNLTKKLREQGQVAKYTFDDMKTNNSKMLNCINLAKKVSKSDLSVLIIGESGTGKELMAQSIHNNSNRKNQPFIAVNCAAVPESLLESQLFGYEKGAFTGALKEGKKGLFEMANNGTIFLDEIGDMPPLLQTKLLRVLQEKQVMPVGSHNVIDIDVRVISATNKNLQKMIKESKFREDLYYRLNVLPIDIPPLRERKEDIVNLLELFLNKDVSITSEANKILNQYNWPGNIRELQNVSSFLNLMCEDIVLKSDLPPYIKVSENIVNDYNLDYNEDEVMSILRILMDRKHLESGIGRGLIIDKLSENGLDFTEGKVRKILTYLNENGYINSKPGRFGSKITDKGEQMYLKLNTL